MVRVVVVQDLLGSTALHEAAGSGHVDTVKALLAAGANLTATTVRGGLCRCRHWKFCCGLMECSW